jgi:hypothetical protein
MTPLEQIQPLLTEWQDLEIQRMILARKQQAIESRMKMMLGHQTDPFGIHAGLDLVSSIDEQKRQAQERYWASNDPVRLRLRMGEGPWPGEQY